MPVADSSCAPSLCKIHVSIARATPASSLVLVHTSAAAFAAAEPLPIATPKPAARSIPQSLSWSPIAIDCRTEMPSFRHIACRATPFSASGGRISKYVSLERTSCTGSCCAASTAVTASICSAGPMHSSLCAPSCHWRIVSTSGTETGTVPVMALSCSLHGSSLSMSQSQPRYTLTEMPHRCASWTMRTPTETGMRCSESVCSLCKMSPPL